MEDTQKSLLIRVVLLAGNLVLFAGCLWIITLLGGATLNGYFIPDRCWPVESSGCNVIVRLILWGGAFVEVGIFSLATYLFNKAVLDSLLIEKLDPQISANV